MLAKSDYVCNLLPSTPKTRGLLDGDVLQPCAARGGAVLINVGRGDIISESSLLRALELGYLRGADLDVFEVV